MSERARAPRAHPEDVVDGGCVAGHESNAGGAFGEDIQALVPVKPEPNRQGATGFHPVEHRGSEYRAQEGERARERRNAVRRDAIDDPAAPGPLPRCHRTACRESSICVAVTTGFPADTVAPMMRF
jgi:hypothetical protein